MKKGLARIAYVADDRTTHPRERHSGIHDRGRRGSALALGAGGAFGLGRRGLFALNGSRELALGNQQVSQEVEGRGRMGNQALPTNLGIEDNPAEGGN
ncbi:hypothetical protein VE03_10360, partial [Pseudogymnoascus sp. 23342-1-I1]